MWCRKRLVQLARERFGDRRLIVVGNREPYIHRYAQGAVECIQPASGVARALDPVMRACGGVWIAHGSGDADRVVVDEHDRVGVPPDDPSYQLRRVWLTKQQEERYYYGLANEGLWPLCHVVFQRPEFRLGDWQAYQEVNQLFADTVLEEAAGAPALVFVQDYHFALLPRMLKDVRPDLAVAQFWHIPWPNRETFRAFPWREELLNGLLGNDLLGFHLRYHCQNFLDTVDRAIEARVDQERFEVTRFGRPTAVRPFPISIDFEDHQLLAESLAVGRQQDAWCDQLALDGQQLMIGIERLDYTKGIPERLRAVDRLLEKYPEYRRRFRFVQVGVPSRSHIAAYQSLQAEIQREVERINWRWAEGAWRPVTLLARHHGFVEMVALHRLARACVVSPLHDGMNVVAKEFIASRSDEAGVLILSQFTGAARELPEALLINPFSTEELADAMRVALCMGEAEQRRRMSRMRTTVANNNVYRWIGEFLTTLLHLDSSTQTTLPLLEGGMYGSPIV